MSDDINLLTIPRPGNEEVRLQLSKWRGHRFINLRCWFRAGGGEMRPGKQGVTLPLHALADIRHALEQAEAIAQSEGLMPDPGHHTQPRQ